MANLIKSSAYELELSFRSGAVPRKYPQVKGICRSGAGNIRTIAVNMKHEFVQNAFYRGHSRARAAYPEERRKIISKMLLTPDDFRVFHYIEGDEIEAETPKGERIWTTIQHMEIIHDHIRPIIIFTLVHSNTRQSATGTL